MAQRVERHHVFVGGGDGGLRSGMALSLIYMIALLKEMLPLSPPLPIKSKCPKTALEEGQLTKVKWDNYRRWGI